MKTKKSLMLIGFAFIFLLTLSVVSAGLFSRIETPLKLTNPEAAQLEPATETFKLSSGEEKILNDGTEVTITGIDDTTGTILGTLATSSGITQSFTLAANTLTTVEGVQIQTGDIEKTWFGLGEPEIPITFTPSPTDGQPINGGEIGGTDFGGSSCELLEEEEIFLGLDEESFINEHIIFLDKDKGLLVDGRYYYPGLEEGGSYLVPIPNPECYWEASFEGGELSMWTVCPPSVEEEPVF